METSIDQFYIISEMIKHRLSELLLVFEPEGLEHKLYKTATVDFLNYLKCHWSYEMDSFIPMDADAEIQDPDPNTKLRTLWCQWLEDNPERAKEELGIWISLWLKKWRERVQILFTDQEPCNKDEKQLQKLHVRGNNVMGLEERKRFKSPVIYTLVSKGEIVSTEFLADTIIKREAGKLRSPPRELKDKIQFLNSCIKQVRDYAACSNKLIFLSVKDFKWRFK